MIKKILLFITLLGAFTIHSCSSQEDIIKDNIEKDIKPFLFDPQSYTFYSMKRINLISKGNYALLIDDNVLPYSLEKQIDSIMIINAENRIRKFKEEHSSYSFWSNQKIRSLSNTMSMFKESQYTLKRYIEENKKLVAEIKSDPNFSDAAVYVYKFRFKSLDKNVVNRLETKTYYISAETLKIVSQNKSKSSRIKNFKEQLQKDHRFITFHE